MPDTLQWAREMPEFRNWMVSDAGAPERILWIRGKIGVGKSVMAAYFIDLLKCFYPHSIVAYFFCRQGQQELTTARDIIRTLSYQCVANNVDGRAALDEMRQSMLRIDGSVSVRFLAEKLLFEPLKRIHKDVYIVIDGLDDADLNAREGNNHSEIEVLLECLARLRNFCSIWLLFISRPNVDVAGALPRLITKTIEDDNSDDIRTYVACTIEESQWLREGVHRAGGSMSVDPISYFQAKANGIFLWVVLCLQELKMTKSLAGFEKALYGFPQTPADMGYIYLNVVSKIEGPDIEWIQEILKWLAIAKRDLEIGELQEVVEWSKNDQLGDFRRYLEMNCASLVHVAMLPPKFDVRTSPLHFSVQLIHETLLSFLVREECPPQFRLDEETLHNLNVRIVKLCVDILSGRAEDFVHFQKYASRYWVHHLVDVTRSKQLDYELLTDLYNFFHSENCRAWIKSEYMERVGNMLPDESYVPCLYKSLASWANALKGQEHPGDLSEPGSPRRGQYLAPVRWALDILDVAPDLNEYVLPGESKADDLEQSEFKEDLLAIQRQLSSLSSFSRVSHPSPLVEMNLSVNFPLNIMADFLPLAQKLYHLLLNGFIGCTPEFSFGYDILPPDAILENADDGDIFTEMLWVSYGGPGNVTKDIVARVVAEIADLISPNPVAAEDVRVKGLGIIASDAGKECIARQTVRLTEADDDSVSCDSPRGPTEGAASECKHDQLQLHETPIFRPSRNGNNEEHVSNSEQLQIQVSDDAGAQNVQDATNTGPSGSQDRQGEADARPNQPSHTPAVTSANPNTGQREQQLMTNSRIPGTAIATTPDGIKVSSLEQAVFVGRLNIKTCEGYQQVLEIRFEPTITANTSDLQQVANTICMKFVKVIASRTKVAKSAREGPANDTPGQGEQPVTLGRQGANNVKLKLRKHANLEEDGYDPLYVTETATITVGASGGRPSEPENFEPREEYFVGMRTASSQYQISASVQGSVAPQGTLTYMRGGGSSQEMIPMTLGLRPRDFGSGVSGCKRWHYDVLGSYKSNLQCSERYPPQHHADITSNFKTVADDIPDYLLARVKTEFRLRKQKWSFIRAITPTQAWRRSHIRHISLRLEARIKRGDPEDYFALPGTNKRGAEITFDIEFEEEEIGRSLHGTTRTAAEEADFTEADFNFEGSYSRPAPSRLSY